MASQKLVVEGLGGAKKLQGTISVKGAKNAVLKSMAATLLFKGSVTLTNVPYIEDVERVCELLLALGAEVTRKDDTCTIDTSAVTRSDLDDDIARRLRASIVFMGPLLGRFGRA